MIDTIHSLVQSRSSHEAFKKLDLILSHSVPKELAIAFASCSRFLGKKTLNPNKEERSRLSSIDADVDWNLWREDDLGRLLILRKGLEVEETFLKNLEEYFDLQEAISVSRILPLLDDAQRFKELAAENCRSNSESLFQAMAWGNPYPARHFNELTFNHMILKALFLNISLKPVVGLETRLNSELKRMAKDYMAELKAAGRPQPNDVECVL